MSEIKRVHYFNQQFLTEKDFRDEQAYHLQSRRRHNRELHTWGIAQGFEVERQGASHILIRPGFAVDRNGREIVLSSPEDHDVGSFGNNIRLYVSVQYNDRMSDDDRQTGAVVEDYTRVTEAPEIVIRKQEPEEGDLVPVAVVVIDAGGRIERIETAVRRDAGPFIAPGSIRTEHLANGSITSPKLSRDMELVSGWVRHCFKPHAIATGEVLLGTDKFETKPAYLVGETEAISKERAFGSMGIVSPPGARRALEFTVAGSQSGEGITAVLYRSGWNEAESTHDREELIRLEHKGEGKKPFRIHGAIEPARRALDTHYSALAVVIESTKAKISLVAVRFEYQLDA